MSAPARYGRQLELGQDLCWGGAFYIADSQAEAIARARLPHDERYKWFAPFGFVRYTDEEGRPWGTPGAPARMPTIEDGVTQKAWLCGPADLIIERLKELEVKYPGLEDVMFQGRSGRSRGSPIRTRCRRAECHRHDRLP